MTTDEFHAWAAAESGKWQLVDGEPRAMAPASRIHGTIQLGLGTLLRVHLRGSGCTAITEPAIVPRVCAGNNMRVPDLAVTCSPAEPGAIEVVDPVLLVEILSPNNEPDTWANIWTYTSIPSVREILVLQSTSIAALLFRREPDGTWPANPSALGAEDALELTSVRFRCKLTEVYESTYLARG